MNDQRGVARSSPCDVGAFELTFISQSITFTSTPPTNVFAGATYAVTAAGGASGDPVVFSTDAQSGGCTTTSTGAVTFTGAGLCVIDANQAGDAAYAAALQVQQRITVGFIGQSIAFTSTPPSNVFAGATYAVTAAGGASGDPVVFSTDAQSGGCTTTSTGAVTFTGAGLCVIDADQAGDAAYAAALQVQQRITVGFIGQSIAFTSTPPSNVVAGATYAVTATGGGSRAAVVFSTDAQSVGCTTTSTGAVTFTGAGLCVIDADQAGDAAYAAALQVQQRITVITNLTPDDSPPIPVAPSASGAPDLAFSGAPIFDSFFIGICLITFGVALTIWGARRRVGSSR